MTQEALPHLDLVATTRHVLTDQISRIDSQIAELTAQRNALAHVVDSKLLNTFVQHVQDAVEHAKPSLQSVLLEVFRTSGHRLRTSDVVRAVVKERGLPVTQDEVHQNLRQNNRFAMHGKGWWRLLEDESSAHGSRFAGGAPV